MSVEANSGAADLIAALMFEHAWRLDHGMANQLHELYVDDGTLIGAPGGDLQGAAAIQSWGEARSKTKRQTRHLISNVRLTPISSSEVRATSIFTLYRHDGDSLGTALPALVGDYEDIVLCISGKWLFKERRIVTAFVAPASRT